MAQLDDLQKGSFSLDSRLTAPGSNRVGQVSGASALTARGSMFNRHGESAKLQDTLAKIGGDLLPSSLVTAI